jgi:hypothetical protein
MGRKKIRPEKITNDVSSLCDLVNKKYSLKPNDIGSIEYHNDTTENSIVQICNEARGTRQLIYGDNTTLKKYLQNILNDTVALYSL